MFEIRNEVEIEGTVEQVWEVLTGFAQYAEWNPVIQHVAGALSVGEHVVITVRTASGERTWDCEVVRVDAGREFAWKFHERAPFLYRGEHTFRIEPIDHHTTRYVDRETFEGLLVPLRKHHLSTKLKAGMVAMGEALKQRVENGRQPI
jgi:hypothetical protein